ncbi:MAG: FAD-dependent oxidoreductase [Phenylobacterium sp.]|nr:FAD-dependent oxidoreductase [Phenylobacterium sp.]
MTDADALLIGASPIMLMRGVILASRGAKVVLLERSDQPGGAWATPPLLGFDRVEAGVHLLEARPAFYSALEQTGGMVLATAELGRDFALLRGRRVSLSGARAGFHAAVAAKALLRGERDKATRIGVSALRAARQAGRPFRYPLGGAWDLTDGLLGQLRDLGAEVRFGAEVRGIGLKPSAGQVECETTIGTFRPGQVTVSSRAHAPLFIDGVRQAPETEPTTCHSVVLHVVDHAPGAFGYVEVLGDPVIKRVRDVSLFAAPSVPAGQALICLQLREALPADGLTLAGECRDNLVRLGLLSAGATVIAAARHDYGFVTITDHALRHLRRLSGGLLDVLHSTDFADGYMATQAPTLRAARADRRRRPAFPSPTPN